MARSCVPLSWQTYRIPLRWRSSGHEIFSHTRKPLRSPSNPPSLRTWVHTGRQKPYKAHCRSCLTAPSVARHRQPRQDQGWSPGGHHLRNRRHLTGGHERRCSRLVSGTQPPGQPTDTTACSVSSSRCDLLCQLKHRHGVILTSVIAGNDEEVVVAETIIRAEFSLKAHHPHLVISAA